MRRLALGSRFALGLIAATLVAGCGPSSASGSKRSDGRIGGTITVDAAASLTEAFTTLKARFEKAHPGTTVKLAFGGSSELATQIQQGAPVDVFASASTKNLAALGGDALAPRDFVENRLEIAVPPGNPAHVAAVADLAEPGVKVAVCDPAVPCGAAAATVFANAKVTVKPAASLADVKSTLAAVESGEVDAGLVYVTDVRAAGAEVQGVAIPAGVNASTTYPIAVLKHARNPGLARAWVDYVLSTDGRQVLEAAGFRVP